MADPSHPKSRRRSAKPEAAADSAAERADPAQLAERFLDLWQDQLGAIATDPDLAELVARLWTQWLVGPGWHSSMGATPPRPGEAGAPDTTA